MTENEQIIVNFIRAWSRLDASELSSYFTDNGTYHNMPTEPVDGRENIEAFIKSFIASWKETQWDVLNMVSKGNIVIAERIDRTKMVNNKSVDLPATGVFELEKGKRIPQPGDWEQGNGGCPGQILDLTGCRVPVPDAIFQCVPWHIHGL